VNNLKFSKQFQAEQEKSNDFKINRFYANLHRRSALQEKVMLEIGQVLTQERRKRGLSLSDVEKAIKVRSKYLKALEESNFDVIPGDAYVVGFLKLYANFLGLDSKPLIDKYRDTRQSQVASKPTYVLEPETPNYLARRITAIALVAIFIALTFFLIWLSVRR
jgi:cytoskeletal protein RodZ